MGDILGAPWYSWLWVFGTFIVVLVICAIFALRFKPEEE